MEAEKNLHIHFQTHTKKLAEQELKKWPDLFYKLEQLKNIGTSKFEEFEGLIRYLEDLLISN